MSPPDKNDDHPNEPLDTRLRVDPNKVAAARGLLGDIDRLVFATGDKHGADAHAGLIARAARALFGNG